MIKRAWATLETKKLDEEKRLIQGIASTPVTDRQEDIMDPFGAKFGLPLPLCFQHRTADPIGQVIDAEVSDKGIGITAQIDKGMPHIDHAWGLIKRGLVRGLSIGFRPLEHSEVAGSRWGRHYKSWEWLELSAVTIAANQDASIANVKAFDLQQMRSASGTAPLPIVRLGALRPAAADARYVIRRIHPLNENHR